MPGPLSQFSKRRDDVIPRVLGPLEQVGIVPEIVMPEQAPASGKLQGFLIGSVAEADEPPEEFLIHIWAWTNEGRPGAPAPHEPLMLRIEVDTSWNRPSGEEQAWLTASGIHHQRGSALAVILTGYCHGCCIRASVRA
jgi:hypothetical protein